MVGLWLLATSVISLVIPIPMQDIWLAITNGGGLTFTGIIFRNQIKRSVKKIEN